jgi:hypothetical protein
MHLCNIINVGTNSYVVRNIYMADCSDEWKLILTIIFATSGTTIKIIDQKMRL